MKTFSKLLFPLLAAVLTGAAALSAQTASPAYNKSQQKGSHNTEQRDETLKDALDFDWKQPYQGGVRNLEFDLVLSNVYLEPQFDWPSTLQHGGKYNWKLATLYDALKIIHNWHLAHPGHEVVTVSLDLKDAPNADDGSDGNATYTQKIEQTFTETLGAGNLYTPRMLQGDHPTLLDGARAQGWPTIDKLKDKFILVFTGSDSKSESNKAVVRRRAYLSQDTKNRMAFVDIDQRTAGNDLNKAPYTDGNRVFINIEYGRSGWCELALKAQAAGGFATRAYTLNNESDWNAALRAAVNILATDKVRNHEWAMVGKEPIVPAPVPGKCES
ncbi:MAG TPA: Ca2+-dependent phosphoinositide-specific phospholipase C [Thermoanaerobaculia bacterium]|nr:Ca2+-dependent phosphoinositide-specific phospholipase C [Thermoanaerobaculia bacterium]